MKRLFPLLLSSLVLVSSKLPGQNLCKEYHFNAVEKRVIVQYVSSCIGDHWFVNGKGVVQIARFINEKGQKCWYLTVLLDDRYKENPPTEYARLSADVVLIYEADVQGKKISTPPTAELLACLEEVILDKLYIRPPPKEQFVTVQGKKVVLPKRVCQGNCANDWMVVFHQDNTFTKVPVF